MPYVKPRTQSYAALRRLLNTYELNTGPALAAVLVCSANTARDRIKDPGAFSLRELSMLGCRGHIPIEEIRAAVTLK